MCEAWLCCGEVMTPLWWAHNTIQSMWLEVVVVGGLMSAVRESLPRSPPPHPSPPLVFASCLLLIRGPWRRLRSVPWSRFQILSDCCARERGWGRAGTWPLAPPLQVRRWSLCDVMMASPDCPHRAIFRPLLVHFTIYASRCKKGWKRSACPCHRRRIQVHLLSSSFPLINVESKWVVVFCVLRQIRFPPENHAMGARTLTQTFALKHDHLLPIKLNELIWRI